METGVEVGRLAVVKGESLVEDFAARKLQQALSEISGRKIPLLVSTQKVPATTIRLLVGHPRQENYKLPEIPEGTIEIRRLNKNTFLFRGSQPAGTLDAVYQWLDLLGCRWFHPEVQVFPRLTRVEIPEMFSYQPSFAYRDALWKEPLDGDWASRNHLNGFFTGLKKKHGRWWDWEPFTHSFYQIVPPSVYGEKHPEYFSYRHGQGHLLEGAQLCLSHPDVFRLALDFVLKKMAAPNIRVVAVAQMDCGNYCQCPECEKRDKSGKSPAASILHFVNRLAEESSRFYPDKYVATLAYQYSQLPPVSRKAHPNVIVVLCHMEPSCDFHPLNCCPHNRFYVECLQKWTEICPHVYVWHYVTNFLHNLSFHPNLEALKEDINFYQRSGVWGIFFQGQRQKGVSFSELHAFCQARLSWDARKDYFQEAADFCRAYYGAAGEAIIQLIKTIHENVQQGFHGHLYTHPAEGIFSRKQLKKAEFFLKEAEEAGKKDPQVKLRVELVRLWFNYTWLSSIPPVERKGNSLSIQAAPEARAFYLQIKRLMKKHQITHVQEFPASHQSLEEKIGWSLKTRKLKIYRLTGASLIVEIVPELAAMVCTMKKPATSFNPCCQVAPWILRYPTMGGLTEGCTEDSFGAGFMEPYQVLEEGRKHLTVKVELANQVTGVRSFILEEKEPVLKIKSLYTNHSAKKVKLVWHVFSVWKMGSLKDIIFFRRKKDGSIVQMKPELPLSTVSATEWVSWKNENLPVKTWGFFHLKLKCGIQHQIEEKISLCRSNAYTRDQRVLLEVLGKPVFVKPGKQVVFQHAYCLKENV